MKAIFAAANHGPRYLSYAAVLFGAPLLAPAAVAQEADEVRISVEAVAPGIEMLVGRGGNIGLAHGERTFVVDDQYGTHAGKIRATIRTITNREPDFVLNTHWHSDHTGGNEALARRGALVVAHENVRRRMSTEQFMEFFNSRVQPSPEVALPVVTFTRDLSFHINDQKVSVFHTPAAHTDGDAVVHFVDANVIHAGDIVFNGIYPFIDYDSGGSISGVIEAVESILALCDAQTRIMPGHGPLASRADLEAYGQMLSDVRGAMARAMAGGASLEEVQAARPTAGFDEAWGDGFISPERFVGMLYKGMRANDGR